MSIMREIGKITRSLETISNIEFRDINLEKGQYILVVRICENRGISQEDLSNMVKVDRTTVSKAIKKLEKSKYVEKRANEKDKRAWKLHPTEKALRIYKFLKEEEVHTTQKALSGLSVNEVTILEELLIRVRENIDEEWLVVKRGGNRQYLHDSKERQKDGVDKMKINFEIIDYKDSYKDDYVRLNLSWLKEYNLLEEKDVQIIQNLDVEVFNKGGKVFLLKTEDERIVGTIGLLPASKETVEIIKLAVDKDFGGRGFGRKLMEKAIKEAYNMGFLEVVLYTNSILKPAIRLYEKLGFEAVNLDDSGYEVVDIKMKKRH